MVVTLPLQLVLSFVILFVGVFICIFTSNVFVFVPMFEFEDDERG